MAQKPGAQPAGLRTYILVPVDMLGEAQLLWPQLLRYDRGEWGRRQWASRVSGMLS